MWKYWIPWCKSVQLVGRLLKLKIKRICNSEVLLCECLEWPDCLLNPAGSSSSRNAMFVPSAFDQTVNLLRHSSSIPCLFKFTSYSSIVQSLDTCFELKCSCNIWMVQQLVWGRMLHSLSVQARLSLPSSKLSICRCSFIAFKYSNGEEFCGMLAGWIVAVSSVLAFSSWVILK